MKKTLCILLCAAFCLTSFARHQGPKSEAEQEKELYEYIQTEVDRLSESLDMEVWQVFYADSILTNNYKGMQLEMKKLGEAKVSNTDIYYAAQDKWMEATYQAFQKILNEDQWKKYCKMGAARDKKARDKRAAKRN